MYMSVKRNYIVGIINDENIDKVDNVISKYANVSKESSSHMYFQKQPIDQNNISQDVIFFQLVSENQESLNEKVKELINDLDSLKTDYVLRDDETGELLVTVKYGGQVAITFDNMKTLPKGTFEKIDELKSLSTEYGYCKGFKPNFRPIEGNPIDGLKFKPEIIYITADSKENLLKLSEYLSEKTKEINPDLETEFTIFFC